jgi:hypothetical protein
VFPAEELGPLGRRLKVAVVEKGQLKGAIRGFRNRETVFQFLSGRKWRQNEYKYLYHYSYMPQARVIETNGRYLLQIEGINDAVEVVRYVS